MTEISKSLNDFRSLANELRKQREEHMNAINKIDQEFLGFQSQVAGIVKGSKTVAVSNNIATAPAKRGPGRPAGSRNVRKASNEDGNVNRSRGRNGGLSGTQKIEAILEKASDKRMLSGDLARAAEKQGVVNPHSSYQSLKRRGRINLKDGYVILVG